MTDAVLPVAVMLGDEERGLERFSNAAERIARGQILYAPARSGLVLLSFEVKRAPDIYLELIRFISLYNRFMWSLHDNDVASIYDQGLVRYEERNLEVCDRSGCDERETFQSNVALFRKGSGDCADLVAARCAEPDVVRRNGAPQLELIGERPNGGRAYHAVVLYPDGSSEDPSALLGM